MDSVWVHPAFHRDDRAPRVTVNFQAAVCARDCERSLGVVLETFRGLKHLLFVGTERAMLGRLGALNRVSLVEPWLARAFGHCLHGNPGLKDDIREPSIEELRDKLREYFLYLCYRVFVGTSYPYALYRLCFAMHHLFNRRELVLDPEDLADFYGCDFLPESALEGPAGRQKLTNAWKDLHGLDLFG